MGATAPGDPFTVELARQLSSRDHASAENLIVSRGEALAKQLVAMWQGPV